MNVQRRYPRATIQRTEESHPEEKGGYAELSQWMRKEMVQGFWRASTGAQKALPPRAECGRGSSNKQD